VKKVHLGEGLDFDAHALATSVWAALGIRGSGKSNLAAVIAEGILDAGIPVVVIDAVGPWFSLRLDSDGKTPSRFKIPVLGGAHGDIALPPGAGKQVAEALAASQSSAVLDISMMSKGERVRFAAEFAEAFFEAKKRHLGPVSVIVEESQRLIPQVMRFADPFLSRCLGAFEEMAEVGRNFGIGVGLLSLRPQKINKDVLNLAETVVAFRTLGVLERKAIAEWVQEKGAPGRGEVAGELPSLERGSAIVWSPSLFDVYGRFKLALKSTYDASATPDKAKAAVKMDSLDLASLESAMGKAIADARANDPAELKREVSKLRAELAKRPKSAPVASAAPADASLRRELATWIKLAEQRAEALTEAQNAAGLAHNGLGKMAQDAREGQALIGRLLGVLKRTTKTPAVPKSFPTNHDGQRSIGVAAPTGTSVAALARALTRPPATNGEAMPIGERKILTAAAQYPNGVTREQLSFLAGYKSSARDTYVSRLRTKGFVNVENGSVIATEDGVAALGDFEALPTGDALRDYWMARLPPGELRILEALVNAYPGSLTRDQISDVVDYKSSARDTYISRLNTRKLIKIDRGTVCARPELFG
jgi:hypothetical protein